VPDPGSGGTTSAEAGTADNGGSSGLAGNSSGGTGATSGGAGAATGEAGASSGAAGDSSAGAAGAAGAGGTPGGGGTSGGATGGTSGGATGGTSGGATGGTSGGATGCAMPACTPNQTETVMQACGACGTGKQSHTRTCSSDGCAWGAWSEWTTCSGVTAACTPGATSACTNGDSCGHRVCGTSCTWGACTPKQAGGCLRIREGHSDEGSNYRCCGARGHWEFCLSSCQWSGMCVACSEGAPSYCTECYP
jgi:hypothetical protein